MVIILLAAALILGIAFFQAIQGVYSSLIMAILSILCAVIAFNFYEPLAQALYDRQPAQADAVALIVLFFLPFIALRHLADWLLRGNVVMSLWVNRVAGGALGLLSGMVVTGVLMVAAQMLPYGETVLSYAPYDETLQRNQSLSPFYPDEFTVAMVRFLSAGSMSPVAEAGNFGKRHDDLLLECYCARNTAGRFTTLFARPQDLTLLACMQPSSEQRKEIVHDGQLAGDSSLATYVVRVAVDQDTRETLDNWWHLPATQFRLVGQSGRSYYPVGYLTGTQQNKDPKGAPAKGWMLHAAEMKDGRPQVGQLIVDRPWANAQPCLNIDWVYQLPSEDLPTYVLFRRVASAKIELVTKDAMPPVEGSLERMAKK